MMPEEWTRMPLEECAKFIDYRGRTPKKTDSGLRLITAKNAKMGYLQHEPREFVAPESYDAWMTRGIPLKGDVIFTTEAPLGNVCQLDTDEKVVFAQRIITLQTDREILNPSFLKYSLMNPQMQSIILKQATGATVSGIKSKLLKKIEISFPSLSEQQRIVNILDEAFERIDNRIIQVEHGAQSAMKLYSSRRDSIYSELLENIESVVLDKLCYFENGDRGKNYPSRSTYTETGIPMISAAHLGDSGLDMGKMNFIPRKRFELLRAGHVAKGDILYCLRGSLGKCAIVRGIEEGAIASSLVIVRTSEKLNNLYLLEYLKSRHGEALIRKYSNGTAQPNLAAKSLRKFLIPMASNQEQINIVNELQELKIRTNELASSYQNTFQKLEHLKQSILQEAFNGNLTKEITA